MKTTHCPFKRVIGVVPGIPFGNDLCRAARSSSLVWFIASLLLLFTVVAARAIPPVFLPQNQEDGSGMYIADTIHLFAPGTDPALVQGTPPEDDNKIPVLLVHGINPNSVPGPSLQDSWHNFMAFFNATPALKSTYKPYIVAYKSNVVSIDQLGLDLGILLDRLDPMSHGLQNKPFVILAHSMGGLISRAMMNKAQSSNGVNWGTRVLKLITLATPHHGSPLADNAAEWGPLGNALGSSPTVLSLVAAFYDRWCATVPYDADNRSDLRWDNYNPNIQNSSSWNDFPNQTNQWLPVFNSMLNIGRAYDTKIIAYAGIIGPSGHGSYDYGEQLIALAIGLGSDGAVPAESAHFDQHPVSGVRTKSDYDHTEMWEGKSGGEPPTGGLFADIRDDLNSIASKLPAPFSITALSQSANGASYVQITTTAQPLAGETYKLFRNGQPYQVFGGLTVQNSQVTPGNIYTYYVEAKNAIGTTNSNSVQVTVASPTPTVPAAPSDLVATAISPTQINLSWVNHSNIATGNIIERKTIGGAYAPIPGSPFPASTTVHFDNAGLSPETLYFYRVIAAGSPNSLPSSEVSTYTQSTISTARVLTMNSANPASGVHLFIGPNDINGLADGGTAFSRQYTSSVTATVVAPAAWNGNAFQKWQKDGQEWTTSTIADVIMDSSHTMTAVYATPVVTGYSISTTRSPLTGGGTSGDGTYASGANVMITATPAAGYHFLNWTLNTGAQTGGTVFSASSTFGFAASGNLSLVANFAQDGVGSPITTTASPANGGSTTGAGVYQNGQLAPVTATPASGWEFGTWTDEYGALVSFSSSFTYPVYQSHNYVAHFNPILAQNYTLSITASNGTAIRSPNQVAYTPGSQVTITATPNSGYLFAGWAGDASGTQNPLTVTMNANKAVTATFSAVPPSTYTVTLPARTGGTVSKSPDLAFYSQGSVVTLTASPTGGYVFGSWRRDTFGNSNPIQITMDGNKTAVADFIPSSPGSTVLVIGTPTNISLPATAGNGTLTVINQGSGIMYWSASPTVSWLQVNGSGSTGVTGGGGSNGMAYSWLDNPTASPRSGEIRVYSPGAQQNPQIFTITQAAGVAQYVLNVTADNGTVTKSPDQANYTPGTQVTLTAAAIAGYQFTGWSGAATGTQTAITITMDGNKSITANFLIVPVPDLFPTVSVPEAIAYAGTSYALTGTVGNRGVGLSNSFNTYCLFSSSNLAPPSTDLLNTTTPVSFTGVNAGVNAPLNTAVNVPGNLSPGNYYLWVVVDPETTSGESAGNRGNNNVVVPFTVLPAPAASGPDLVLHDFSVSPSGALPGSNIEVNGRISNWGTGSSTGCNCYLSISASATVAPANNALNTVEVLPSLGVGLDVSLARTIALPSNLSAGNYYLWIIADPESAAGEPAGNQSNNTMLLPLTIVQPSQTFTVAASASPVAGGSVSGDGTYASGALVPLIATPAAGYRVVNWTEGGIIASTEQSYVFTATSDRALVANFLFTTWVATPSAGANGTVDPSAPQTVVNGSGTTFTATPNANYRVNAWSVNGNVVQVGGTTFTMSNVTANTAVGVTFKPTSLPAPGDLDPTFDTDGKVVTAFGTSDDYGQGVAVQIDGKIVAAGYTKNGSNYDLALARYNADGTLDTSFNGAGQVTCPTGSTSSFTPGMAIQNDGKILIAGWFTLARYNTDGSLDTAFNSTGKVTTPYFAQSMAVQNDGKIVVAGYFTISGSNDFAVVRYNANGTLDTSFNGTGKVTTAVGSGADIGYQVVLQSDGKILVTGYTTLAVATDRAVATVRYNSNGSLDTSFNGTGIVTTDFGTSDDEGKGMAVQSDGKIVVAGFGGSSRHILLVRYNTSGSLDTTFNGTGQLVTTGNISVGGRVVLQTDGKILVAGSSANFFALVRCNANGSMDTSFNDTGIVTTDIGIGADFGSGIALQSDGKIVVIGQVSNGSNYDFGLARYLAVAEPDITVEQPLSTNVASGSSKSFGSLDVGTNASLTFTIKNTGGTDLTGLTLIKDGTDAAMFTLTASPVAPVSQNGSTTFTVRFAPTSAGVKTAALHIASNVAAKNPFDIALTGSGNTPSESWRQEHFGTAANSGDAADTFDYDRDGIVNLAEYAFGLNPTLNSAGQLPQGQKTGSNFVISFTQSAGVTGITYGAEWSTTMASNDWHSITDTGTPPQHTFSVPISGNQALFIRLKVTSP